MARYKKAMGRKQSPEEKDYHQRLLKLTQICDNLLSGGLLGKPFVQQARMHTECRQMYMNKHMRMSYIA